MIDLLCILKQFGDLLFSQRTPRHLQQLQHFLHISVYDLMCLSPHTLTGLDCSVVCQCYILQNTRQTDVIIFPKHGHRIAPVKQF